MEITEEQLPESFKNSVRDGVKHGKRISMITHVLGENGEARLKFIFTEILEKVGRVDLMELLYTSAKELIVNSTKAAIKRMIFEELHLNIDDEDQYEQGMKYFKSNLNDKKFPAYKQKMKETGYFVKISCQCHDDLIELEIRNNFSLIKVEENRIREKFLNAKKYDNLFEFFMEHGDNTEGAGMGITMVEILLSQSGFDRRLFKMYSSHEAKETVARVQIPLGDISKLKIEDEQLFTQ